MVEIAVQGWDALSRSRETMEQLEAEAPVSVEENYRYFVTYPEEQVRIALRDLEKSGVRIWSVHAPFGAGVDLSDPDEGRRCGSVEQIKFVLSRVAWSGAHVLVVHPGKSSPDSESETRMRLLVESLEQIMPFAEEADVRIGLENMLPHHPCCDIKDLLRVVEEVDHPDLGICFDTGHSYVNGSLLSDLEAVSDRVVTFHMADNDGTRDMHVQPPYGSIPWEDFSERLDAIGFTDPLVVEAAPWQGRSFGQLIREVGALLEGERVTREVDGRRVHVRCSSCGHFLYGDATDSWCACPGTA